MQAVSIESKVSNFDVDPVFNGKPVKLSKQRVGIGLVGIRHDTCQEILSSYVQKKESKQVTHVPSIVSIR